MPAEDEQILAGNDSSQLLRNRRNRIKSRSGPGGSQRRDIKQEKHGGCYCDDGVSE